MRPHRASPTIAPDRRPVQRQFGHPCRRRRLRHPGWQAARAALADQKKGREAVPPHMNRRAPSPRCCRRGRSRSWAPARARAVSANGWSSRPGAAPRACTWSIRATRDIDGIPAPHRWRPSTRDRPGVARVPDAALLDELKAAAAVGARSAVIFGSANGRLLREAVIEIAGDAGDGIVRRRLHGLRQQRDRAASAGYLEPIRYRRAVSRWSPIPARFSTVLRAGRGFGFPAGRVVGSGTGDQHRRLRRVHPYRPGHHPDRAAAGDAAGGGLERSVPPGGRAGHPGGDPAGRPLPAAGRWSPRTPARWPATRRDGRRSARTPAHPGRRHRRVRRHHPGFSRASAAAGPARAASRPCTTPGPNGRLCADRPTSWAWTSVNWPHRRLRRSVHNSTKVWRRANPLDVCGVPGRTPANCSAPACGRCGRPRGCRHRTGDRSGQQFDGDGLRHTPPSTSRPEPTLRCRLSVGQPVSVRPPPNGCAASSIPIPGPRSGVRPSAIWLT